MKCDLLNSTIARDFGNIKALRNEPGSISLLKMQLKQRGIYENKMNESYIKFTKFFDLCVVAENAIANASFDYNCS